MSDLIVNGGKPLSGTIRPPRNNVPVWVAGGFTAQSPEATGRPPGASPILHSAPRTYARNRSPQVLCIVLHPVLRQQGQILFLKRPAAVMLLLASADAVSTTGSQFIGQ